MNRLVQFKRILLQYEKLFSKCKFSTNMDAWSVYSIFEQLLQGSSFSIHFCSCFVCKFVDFKRNFILEQSIVKT